MAGGRKNKKRPTNRKPHDTIRSEMDPERVKGKSALTSRWACHPVHVSLPAPSTRPLLHGGPPAWWSHEYINEDGIRTIYTEGSRRRLVRVVNPCTCKKEHDDHYPWEWRIRWNAFKCACGATSDDMYVNVKSQAEAIAWLKANKDKAAFVAITPQRGYSHRQGVVLYRHCRPCRMQTDDMALASWDASNGCMTHGIYGVMKGERVRLF